MFIILFLLLVIFHEAIVTAVSAALAAHIRKHRINDERCVGNWAGFASPLMLGYRGCSSSTVLSIVCPPGSVIVCNELFGRL